MYKIVLGLFIAILATTSLASTSEDVVVQSISNAPSIEVGSTHAKSDEISLNATSKVVFIGHDDGQAQTLECVGPYTGTIGNCAAKKSWWQFLNFFSGLKSPASESGGTRGVQSSGAVPGATRGLKIQ